MTATEGATPAAVTPKGATCFWWKRRRNCPIHGQMPPDHPVPGPAAATTPNGQPVDASLSLLTTHLARRAEDTRRLLIPPPRGAASTEALRDQVARLVRDHGITDDENGELFADRLDDLLRTTLPAETAEGPAETTGHDPNAGLRQRIETALAAAEAIPSTGNDGLLLAKALGIIRAALDGPT